MAKRDPKASTRRKPLPGHGPLDLAVSGSEKRDAISRAEKSSKRRELREPGQTSESDYVDKQSRLKRIENLKKAVATSSYKVSDEDLAGKILDYMLQK